MGPDDIGVLIAQEIARTLAAHLELSWALIDAYDPATHTAHVTLQPAGTQGRSLPVGTPALGLAHPVAHGTQCVVALMQGQPTAVLALYHSTSDPVPSASAALEGDVFIGGVLTVAGGVRLPLGLVLPPAVAARRGEMRVLAPTPDGEAGTADTVQALLQAADGSLSWVTVATG